MKTLAKRAILALTAATIWVAALALLVFTHRPILGVFSPAAKKLLSPGVIAVIALTGSWNWAMNHGGTELLLPFNVVFYAIVFFGIACLVRRWFPQPRN